VMLGALIVIGAIAFVPISASAAVYFGWIA
jgi:hypothetical protein